MCVRNKVGYVKVEFGGRSFGNDGGPKTRLFLPSFSLPVSISLFLVARSSAGDSPALSRLNGR